MFIAVDVKEGDHLAFTNCNECRKLSGKASFEFDLEI